MIFHSRIRCSFERIIRTGKRPTSKLNTHDTTAPYHIWVARFFSFESVKTTISGIFSWRSVPLQPWGLFLWFLRIHTSIMVLYSEMWRTSEISCILWLWCCHFHGDYVYCYSKWDMKFQMHMIKKHIVWVKHPSAVRLEKADRKNLFRVWRYDFLKEREFQDSHEICGS